MGEGDGYASGGTVTQVDGIGSHGGVPYDYFGTVPLRVTVPVLYLMVKKPLPAFVFYTRSITRVNLFNSIIRCNALTGICFFYTRDF